MKFLLAFSLLPFLLITSSPLLAQSGQNCAQIKDPDERLACYDEAYQASGAVESVPPVATSKQRRNPREEAVEQIDEVTAPNARVGTAASENERPRSKGMFSRRDKVDFSATISALRAGEKQRMIFLLDNEQVWMQSSPREMTFKKGDQITI